MTTKYKKLMLFAFNGECDSYIAKVKWNNAEKAKDRINKAHENINKLGITHNISITEPFLQLKLEELALTYEYEQKKYDEKEEQRLIREQLREEEKAQRELEKAQKEAEDEERRFEKALEKAKQELGSSTAANVDTLNEQIKNLEQQLQEAHERKERAISLAQQTKVGHIYIISNIGSFGQDIYKIGMTRRLDPLDRVKELGDASVPFHFDIHAIIYSENAPQLEYELHRKFGERRLNRINNKKEFFRVTLHEIETFIKEHTNAEIQFTQLAEAREYRETLTLLEQLNKLVDHPKEENKFPTSLV
jgi:flagellar biosynthesis GTPase FlhF